MLRSDGHSWPRWDLVWEFAGRVHYFNPSWSHAHSAFAVALFLWYWMRTRNARTWRQWGFLAAGGLVIDVYYLTGHWFLLPFLESLAGYKEAFRQAIQTVWRATVSRRMPFLRCSLGGTAADIYRQENYLWELSAHWIRASLGLDFTAFFKVCFLGLTTVSSVGLLLCFSPSRAFSFYEDTTRILAPTRLPYFWCFCM